MASNRVACTNCGVKHRDRSPEECEDRGMSEATLQKRVVGRAKRAGWTVKHVGKGMTGAGGVWVSTAKNFPDLFCLNPDVYPYRMGIELKKQTGEFEEGQEEYLELLNRCGIPAFVIRPSHLRDGTVRAILSGT